MANRNLNQVPLCQPLRNQSWTIFAMNRELIPTTAFTRAVRRYLRRNEKAADRIEAALETLADDAFAPRLRTHKLKGDLAGTWACSAGKDLRILFQFVETKNGEAQSRTVTQPRFH